MSDPSGGFAEALSTLNSLMLGEDVLPSTLDRVVGLACAAVSGCDSSGVTVWHSGHPATVAHAGALALALDDAQYRADDGPCTTAHRERRLVHVPDIRADERSPGFTAARGRSAPPARSPCRSPWTRRRSGR